MVIIHEKDFFYYKNTSPTDTFSDILQTLIKNNKENVGVEPTMTTFPMLQVLDLLCKTNLFT